jgi:Ni/Co efflux regulator RcnB
VEKWKSGWFKTRNRSGREGSHLHQARQRRVHSNRIREAGGSQVANYVVAKAGRFARTHHIPLRERDELVGVGW